jgi:hypothetical protein
MFPIISAFIAVGKVFSAVSLNPNGSDSFGFGSGTVMQIIGLVAYFLPNFLLPIAFRLATGVIGSIAGFVNDRNRGVFDRLKKYRGNSAERRMGYYKQHVGDRVMQTRAQAVRRLNAGASGSGRLKGGLMRLAGRQVAGLGGIEAKMSAINARTSKEMNDQIATGIDSDIRGSTVNLKAIKDMGWNAAVTQGLARTQDGKRQYKSLAGAWVDEADVFEGHRKYGNDVAAQQAALSYEMRKAMTDDQVADVSDRYVSLAKDQWHMTDTQAQGAWIGASFENQNQHIDFKNTSLDLSEGGHDSRTGRGGAKLDAKKFATEIFEKKGSYPLSQMSAHTIRQLMASYDDARASGDTETAQKVQAIAEVFMQRGGAAGPGGVVEVEGETVPVPARVAPGASRSDFYQSNSQGSAHVAQEVRRLAEHVGVYRRDLASPRTDSDNPAGGGGPRPPADIPRLN